jgi:ABC-type multidrug transport system fused ATPase/permease subunit
MMRCLGLLKVTQVDPAGGRILIDGIDITTIGLHDLRSRIVSVQLGC